MTPDELGFLGLREARDLLAARKISAVEIVEAQLGRIERLQPRFNPFITVTADAARRAAPDADGASSRGELLGPLHGVPVTVKDLFWTRGVRTTSGSKILGDFVPSEDAAAVASLRKAGAILLGKTNLHEFAFGVSNVNPHYGPTLNPWDETRISGGSSGGSAVALACGIGYGSLGTDTGGSIRIPAALCGVVGLKPTYGRVSRHGVTPLAWSLDHVGPMARRVEDVAILFEVLAGVKTALGDLPEGLKLGVPQNYFFENIDAEVSDATRRAIRDLEGLGLRPVETTIPQVDYQGACRNLIAFAEAASYHHTWIEERPEDYGADVRESLRLGRMILATEYLAAQRARRTVLEGFREAFREIDLLVTPAAPTTAPKLGEARLSNGEELRPGLLRLPSPFNTVGFPAISLPCGFDRLGLPIGLQIVARPWEESTLLQVAHAFETSRAYWKRRPTER